MKLTDAPPFAGCCSFKIPPFQLIAPLKEGLLTQTNKKPAANSLQCLLPVCSLARVVALSI